MRRIPWRLSLRYSRKGLLTVLGIALGVTFALVSFSVAHGLERDTLGIARNHPEQALVLTAEGGAPFEPARLAAYPGATALVVGEGVDARGAPVVLAAFVGDGAPRARGGVAHPSAGTGAVPIRSADVLLAPGDPIAHPMLPAGWYLVPLEVIKGSHLAVVGFVLDPIPGVEDALRADGFVVGYAPGLQSFFRTSGLEIARDLLLVVVFASALAVMFSYEFLRSEVRESRREIGIWRAVGMRAKDVVALFLARAAAIGILSLAIGWALSWLVLRAAHARTGNASLQFALDPLTAGGIAGAFLVATVLGGVVPAALAGRLTVRAALEGAP